MRRPRIIVFASGTKNSGGSGFRNLVQASKNGVLQAEIVAVVSNYKNGGVYDKAHKLNIPFIHFSTDESYTAHHYQAIVSSCKADWVTLSGWIKMVHGLDPRRTINIHPGPLPDFGGPGLYGYHVHKAVLETFRQGKIKSSAIAMHFVTKEYDKGPIFFQMPVTIEYDDNLETLTKRVNEFEHRWQPILTNHIVNGRIRWDGINKDSLIVPPDIPNVAMKELR